MSQTVNMLVGLVMHDYYCVGDDARIDLFKSKSLKFLERMRSFDVKSLTNEQFLQLRSYCYLEDEVLTLETVCKASPACGKLFSWIRKVCEVQLWLDYDC